jgi:FixJ family two-component response regulator
LYSGRGRFFSKLDVHVAARRPIVAVIEADATDRNALRSLLSTLDVDVNDYDSAESYLASRDGASSVPECFIADVVLPGMSGIELLRVLHATEFDVPVILLGEEADVRSAVVAMREGAIDFIEKPRIEIAIAHRVAKLLKH